MTNVLATPHALPAWQDTGVGDGREPPPPARLARLFSPELVREAQTIFSRRMEREVSEGEARTMLANLTGFMRLLAATN